MFVHSNPTAAKKSLIKQQSLISRHTAYKGVKLLLIIWPRNNDGIRKLGNAAIRIHQKWPMRLDDIEIASQEIPAFLDAHPI